MVMLANQPPQLVYIRNQPPVASFSNCFSGLPFPSTPSQGRWGDEFYNQLSVPSCQHPVKPRFLGTGNWVPHLPLRELEALSCALLSVLLALFGSWITGDHALRLELLAQLDIEK